MQRIIPALLPLLIATAPALAQKPDAAAARQQPAPKSGAAPAEKQAPAKAAEIVILVPSGSQYSAYIEEAASAPVQGSDRIVLPAPSGETATLLVLDPASGFAARRVLRREQWGGEQRFSGDHFNLVGRLEVKLTGKDDLPISGAAVTLTDAGGQAHREVLTGSGAGLVQFKFVRVGKAELTVAPDGGSATKKEVNVDLAPGQPVQVLTVALPEVTNTVAAPAAPAPAAPAPATPSAGATAAPPAPAAPYPPPGYPGYPGYPPYPPPPARSAADNIVMLVILAVMGVLLYLYGKKKGWTVDAALLKLGIQPATPGTAGANLAHGHLSPAPAPEPPPIVSDPNMCQFCGQMKDPSGGCSCSVAPGGAAPAAFASSSQAGPRLVGMAGAYLGRVFPIHGTAVIGRDSSNNVPLDQDTTASRRHAQVMAEGGFFQIQDLGSSNGTFVNGARVTEAQLQPGDEISIGATRFRFEA